MNETAFIDRLIEKADPVMIRLLEGRDISAVPIAQDREAIIFKREHSDEKLLIYKRAISVITPLGVKNEQRFGVL